MSNPFIPDKPFKTYEEMVDLLESRNIIMTNREAAKETLASISYYTLINGYKHLFSFDSNDIYHPPVHFNEFCYLHTFDITINNILFKYIISVENSLKSHMSYILSKNYGVWTDLNTTDPLQTLNSDYLCRSHYKRTQETNKQLKTIKTVASNSEIASVQHYRDNHNHMPCWILIKSLTFGQTLRWFNLLRSPDKGYVCYKLIGESNLSEEKQKEFVNKGLKLLKEYRNSIAHGNIVFSNKINIELPKQQTLHLAKGIINDLDYNRGLGKNDLLATIIAIVTFLSGDKKLVFINEISEVFQRYENIIFSNGNNIYEMLGLPKTIFVRLKLLLTELREYDS